MKILKHIFRYKLTAVYFVIGQLVVYITIFGALQIYNQAVNKEKERVNGLYQNRITMDVNTSADGLDVISDAGDDITEGNLTLGGKISVNFKESGSATRAEVLLAVNETLSYPLISGHIPGTAETDFGRRVVALGRDKYRYAYERDGKKYVTLCLEEYEVVGVIGSLSDYWDYKIVLNVHCMGEQTLSKISNYRAYEINIESNQGPVKSTYEQVFQNIKKKDGRCNISSYQNYGKGENTISNTLNRQNIRVNAMVYVFCLVNSILISYFWIMQRRKEIAIRKAFGYGNGKIVKMLFIEMLQLMLFSLILFLVLYIAAYYWSRNVLHIYLTIETLAGVALIMIVTSVISILFPVIKVLKMNSAQGVTVR